MEKFQMPNVKCQNLNETLRRKKVNKLNKYFKLVNQNLVYKEVK